MRPQVLTAEQKAFQLNMDTSIYGTLAEIGAGQEVARTFFHAGGAAGTIAKTISAYDMAVSDAIYGKEESGRYVCEPRLHKMLKREYDQLLDRLADKRPSGTKFFAFSDTVAAKSYKSNRDCHGWMGVKFQAVPNGEANEAIIHIRMLDRENLQQQQALGIVGVNLIHACYFYTDDPGQFVEALMSGLTNDRMEINMIRASGPAFTEIDSRVLCLELVKKSFTSAVLFDSYGNVHEAAESLYKKNVLILRGSWRPPTLVNMNMLETGTNKLKQKLEPNEKSSMLILPEISMTKLSDKGEIDPADFLARVDLLASLGERVLITNFPTFHELSTYIRYYSKKRVSFVMGVYNLEETFDTSRYEHNSSGLLGALGALIGHNSQIFLYPATETDQGGGELTTKIDSTNLNIEENIKTLIKYLKDEGHLEDITDYDERITGIWSRRVLKMIETSEEGWEKMVPELVSDIIKDKSLFGAKRHE